MGGPRRSHLAVLRQLWVQRGQVVDDGQAGSYPGVRAQNPD
jgi:hypothetical protein